MIILNFPFFGFFMTFLLLIFSFYHTFDHRDPYLIFIHILYDIEILIQVHMENNGKFDINREI